MKGAESESKAAGSTAWEAQSGPVVGMRASFVGVGFRCSIKSFRREKTGGNGIRAGSVDGGTEARRTLGGAESRS